MTCIPDFVFRLIERNTKIQSKNVQLMGSTGNQTPGHVPILCRESLCFRPALAQSKGTNLLLPAYPGRSGSEVRTFGYARVDAMAPPLLE